MIEWLGDIRPSEFQAILDKHERVLIGGTVESGKSLLLETTKPNRRWIHTDTWRRQRGTIRAIDSLAEAASGMPRYLIVGMLVPHILAKGLDADAVLWLARSRNPDMGTSDDLQKLVEGWEAEDPENRTAYLAERALHEDETVVKQKGLARRYERQY